jgi:hypothetical protein
MSFHLSQTPTLEAVSTDDDARLAEDLQARVAEAVAQAEATPDARAAAESSQVAAADLEKLRTAERSLHQWAKEARTQLDEMGKAALDALIDAAGRGAKPDWAEAEDVAALEDQIRHSGRALERLTEHLIPLASIASLREEAHALESQARALEAIAQERAEKVLGQIRAAVKEEMVLPVDMSKGVAGALLARAKDQRRRAVQLAGEADELEQSIGYESRTRTGTIDERVGE